KDGRHGIICTPGSDHGDSSTVQFWYTADGGKTFKHSKMTSPNGGGDCDVDFLPDGTAVAVDLEITDSYLQESTDFGKTWKQIGTPMYVIYSISDAQSNLNPNDGVPPYGPTRGVIVASTTDGGTTWSSHYAVAAPPQVDGSQEESNGAIFPWGSIDRAGTLYV